MEVAIAGHVAGWAQVRRNGEGREDMWEGWEGGEGGEGPMGDRGRPSIGGQTVPELRW